MHQQNFYAAKTQTCCFDTKQHYATPTPQTDKISLYFHRKDFFFGFAFLSGVVSDHRVKVTVL